jgi:hypothetical protein
MPNLRTPLPSGFGISTRLAVFQLADFFHEAFASSQAFRLVLRHPRFGPLRGGLRSITPTFHRKGQHPWFGLVFLPLSAPESRRLRTLTFILFPWRGTVPAFLRSYGVKGTFTLQLSKHARPTKEKTGGLPVFLKADG